MFRVLFHLLLLFSLVFEVTAQAASLPDYDRRIVEEANMFVDCTSFEAREAQVTCEHLSEARAYAQATSLQQFEQVVMTGKRRTTISYREFLLIAFDPVTERWHKIVLGMPVRVMGCPQRGIPLVFRNVNAAEYEVKRLRGCSLNKLVFDVRYQGRELLVYGAKHLLFTSEKLHPFWGGRTVETIEEVVYLATPAHLVTPELARAGHQLLLSAIERAIIELANDQVPSRAFPGELLARHANAYQIANLVLTEQTDPCFLPKRPAFCAVLVPNRPYPDEDQVRDAVKAEFVVNGLAAFRYLQSHANARGVLQFTDNRTEKYLGTYTVVLALYPEARLDPDFRRGTRSLVNMAKAAIALIDLELSNRWLGQWVREVFVRDPEMGLLFPGSAYNGGASQAIVLARLMERFAKVSELSLEEVTFDDFPWDDFIRFLDRRPKALKDETRGYIEKMIRGWQYLRRHRPSVKADFEGVLS